MGYAYSEYKKKLIDTGTITPEEARAFFEDLFEISKKRIAEEAGECAAYFPTKQYRGPGGNSNSPNGWKYGQPIGVCDHHTASDSHSSALKWFSSYSKWNKGKGVVGPSNASACFVIALSGEPFLLIDFWNGKSDWHEPQLNGIALGIEHVNCGELRERNGKFYWWPSNWGALYPYTQKLPPQPVDYRNCKWMQPYTKAQIFTNLLIKRALVCMYKKSGNGMRPELFIDHAMYRNDKVDQGPLWPLADLRSAAFSVDPLKNYKFFSDVQSETMVYTPVNSMDMQFLHRTITSMNTMPVNLNSDTTGKSQVLALQLALKYLGYTTNIDGLYTDVYVNALKSFQSDNGLTVDGIPGPKTRNTLEIKLSEKTKIS